MANDRVSSQRVSSQRKSSMQKGDKIFSRLMSRRFMQSRIILRLSCIFVFFASLFAWRFFVAGEANFANFSPLPAAMLCASAFLGTASTLILSFAWLISYLFDTRVLSEPTLANLSFLFLLFVMIGFYTYGGHKLGKRARLPSLLGVGLAGSILFYLLSNSLAWLMNPAYARDFSGLLQALSVGLPGFPPTYIFFAKSLAGDFFFISIFTLILQRNFALETKLVQKEIAT